jgi:rod shape determining protein RodA
MNAPLGSFGGRPWRDLLRRQIDVLDGPLLAILLLLAAVGLVTMYSSAYDFPGRFNGQVRNFLVAGIAMWLVAHLSPQWLMRLAVPLYLIGVLLLVGVELFGITRKGAQRWLDIGFIVIQPSEIMKIALPLMMAKFFHDRDNDIRWRDWLLAAVLLGLPFLLIIKQPDLGTALLVFSAGFFVIFFAGLSFKLLVPLAVAGVVAIGSLVLAEDTICQPEVDWVVLHSYQKGRVCTLLDPTNDPLGAGFHTIQSTIAVGSGGLFGKGYMEGTQAHLEFIPERTSDFIYAVYAEEFGFLGGVFMIVLYLLLIARGLVIAGQGSMLFGRLLAGSLTLCFFVYAFVNLGMVIGILPVVGVPLPLISYGGTALMTLGIAAGMLMSVSRHRQLLSS